MLNQELCCEPGESPTYDHVDGDDDPARSDGDADAGEDCEGEEHNDHYNDSPRRRR